MARRSLLFVRRFLLKIPNAFLFNLASMASLSCFSTLQTNKKKVNFSIYLNDHAIIIHLSEQESLKTSA